MLRLLAIALVVCVLLKCMGGLGGGGGNSRFVRLDTSQYDSFMDGWEAT
jgi:preprotein translocase subunit SecG